MGIFLLLNSLLFLPIYWFFRADISFWPWSTPFADERDDLLSALFLQRPNLDIFRLNLELLFVVLLWRFVPLIRRGWVVLLVFLLYLSQLVYAVYEGFVRSYYLLDPVFYNDVSLFADGVHYVVRSLNLSPFIYAGVLLLLGLLTWVLYSLHRWLFADFLITRLSRTTQAEMVAAMVSLQKPVLLVQNDCVLTVGTDILNAFDRLEVAEFSARSLIDTAVLGQLVPIGDSDIHQLEKAFGLI